MDYKECFSIFNSSYTNKEIPKDILLNNIDNKEDKEIIERFLENIFLKYCIKAENINKESEKNFSEIEIIEININNYRTIYDIYRILLSIIPYPILAIFRYNDRISFTVSNRIPVEDKNNKGKIFTSYLIKQEDISRYLKIDIDNCQTMIDIYNKWISNVENVVAYYERLDSVMEIIGIGFHIKSDEVLEKLESYIVRDCGTYNMKPKEGWKSKLEKYEDNASFIKKVETHMLWEYLYENTFLKNKLEDFFSWNDFKEACSDNNNMNAIYYSQYNSKMSYNDGIDYIYENRRNNNRYKSHSANIKVETIKSESERIKKNNNIDNTIQEIVEEVKEKGDITYSDLVEIISEKLDKLDTKIINKIYEAFEEYDIKILKDDENIADADEYMEEEYHSIEYERAREEVEKDFALYAIKIDYNVLSYVSVKLLNDKEFMLQAIEKDFLAIRWASDELVNDREFMIEAMKRNWFTIGYASDELKNDKKFMRDVIKRDELYIGYLGNKLKNDKEFMFQAIKQSSRNVAYIGEKLRNDKEFMIKAIKQDSWSILCASYELLNGENFVLQAIKLDSWCINFIIPKLKNNKEFMLKAIKMNSLCIEYLGNELLNDIEFMEKIYDLINVSKYVSKYMITNKEIMLQAIQNKDIWCLAYVDTELRNNKEFMLQAIEKDSSCIGYSSIELLNDREFMIEVIKKNPRCINFANKSLKNDGEFMLQAIKKDIWCIEYASDELKNNKEFMLKAIEKDIRSFSTASDELKSDKEFMLKAIKKDIRSYAFTSSELRYDEEIIAEIKIDKK